MAALNRLTEATYEVHETVKVDTQDNEDHTFCGIMFPIKCKELLPVDHISIRSLAVRGQLGPITIWVSKERPNNNNSNNNNGGRATTASATAAASNNGTAGNTAAATARRTTTDTTTTTNNNGTTVFRLSKSHWTKVYSAVHEPSQDTYVPMIFDAPVVLKPGQVRAIYIHSTLPGDAAIVYDNANFYLPRRGLHPFGHHGGNGNGAGAANQQRPRYDDAMLSIYTGRAHVSNTPFGQMPIWGWGNAWRDHREFVGQLEYGAVYQLWNPETQQKFGPHFKSALFNMKLCQTRWESPVSRLPDECIYYILNMCRWDWFQDTKQTMEFQKQQVLERERLKRQQEQRRRQQEELQQMEQQLQNEVSKAAVATANAAGSGTGGSSSSPSGTGSTSRCCGCNNNTGNNNDDDNDDGDDDDDSDEDYQDAHEDEQENAGSDDDDDDEVVIMDDEEELEEEEDDEEFDEDDLDDEEEDDDDDDDDDDDSSWERANGYRADHQVFRFVDPDHEREEGETEEEDTDTTRQAWMRRQFARIHVLRALAREQDDDDDDVVDMHLVF